MKLPRFVTPLTGARNAVLIIALLAPFSFPQNTPTQATAPKPLYAVFEYMKIEPGKAAEYRKLEKEIWAPIHRERVKAKLIRSWALWGVVMPGGVSREYDTVAITLFDNFKDLENSYPAQVFQQAHPNKPLTEFTTQAGALRKMVRTEVMLVLDAALPGGEDPRAQATAAPPKYARFDYKKVEFGKERNYVEHERKYYKPYWQEVVNQNMLRAWALCAARYPSGSEREYGFMTIQAFDKFEQLEMPSTAAAWAKANPNTNTSEITGQMRAISRTARSEVLTLIDQVR